MYLTEFKITAKEAQLLQRIIKIFKIPEFTFGYALCYYQDLGVESFNVFCLCLLVAHKFHEDYKIRTSTWSKYTQIDKKWLISNEITVLAFFDHHLKMPQKRVLAATLMSMNAFYPIKKTKVNSYI